MARREIEEKIKEEEKMRERKKVDEESQKLMYSRGDESSFLLKLRKATVKYAVDSASFTEPLQVIIVFTLHCFISSFISFCTYMY